MDAVFSLSIEDAERIAWSVATLWAIAFGLKQVRKTILER